MLTALLAIAVLQADALNDDVPREAYVMVQCVAGPNNSVTDCRTLEVSLPGQGLENAALAVVRRGQIGQRNGVDVGQAFRIKINFRLDDEIEPALAPKNNAEARLHSN
ncbi:hypothetical protein D3C73_50090 [compost metagenome]